MAALPYAMSDADNHYYEPDDCFTRHIEAKDARRTDDPHPEGLAQPAEFADELAELALNVVRQVMRENLAGLV